MSVNPSSPKNPAPTPTAPPTPTTPPVEPGYQTTEFWITTIAAGLMAALGIGAAFGLPLNSEQKTAILTAVPVEVTLTAAVYTLARSWRKK